GPRDSLPPELLAVTPRDSTLNFRGDRITFTFDEYIDDPQELSRNLLFTPTFEVNPDIAVRGKTLTLRLRDSLLPNTTYTFNFGDAIRDLNEGNVVRNFVYTFSTGPTIDSLSLSGKVTLAENGRIDSTLIVVLHNKLYDSAVAKERPVYIARVDGSGSFRFRNLPKDTFAIYALGNPNFGRRYQQNELFAFSNEPVLTGLTREVTLSAFRPEQKTTSSTTTASPRPTAGNEKRLRFTTTPASGNLDLQSDYLLNFQSPLRSFDSTKVALTADSTFRSVAYRISLDSTRTVLRFRSQWTEGTRYNIILDRDFADDSAGRKLLKTDTLNFATKKRSDYGELKIRIRNLDSIQNPVLQFVQNDQVVFSAPLTGGVFSTNLFNPGEYELRILADKNKNGKWDPGQFFGEKRQAELVTPLSRKLVVKAGLENDFDVSL
ncbi:MAG: hypothetical protein EON98_08185, partial [Chitinophagaceae bacterium]